MTLLELANALNAAAKRASTGPWRSNTASNMGEDWLLASFGADEGRDADMILTTDRVRASEYDGDGAAADVEFIVLCRNNIEQIVDGLRLASLVEEPELPLPHPTLSQESPNGK